MRKKMVVNTEQEKKRASSAAFRSFSSSVIETRGYRPVLSKPSLPQVVEKNCKDVPLVPNTTTTENTSQKLLQSPKETTPEQSGKSDKPRAVSGAFSEYLELLEVADQRRSEDVATQIKQDALLSIGFRHLYSSSGRSWDV